MFPYRQYVVCTQTFIGHFLEFLRVTSYERDKHFLQFDRCIVTIIIRLKTFVQIYILSLRDMLLNKIRNELYMFFLDMAHRSADEEYDGINES